MSKISNPKFLERKLSKEFEFSVSDPIEKTENGFTWFEFPVTLKARDGGPILHYWWGKVAHDFNGMSVPSIGRIPIDHVHSDDALGFVNEFDTSSGSLILKGFFVSTEKNDLVWKLATQMKAGIPYQSSIFFDDPENGEMEIEEVKKNKDVTVNEQAWTGPGLVVRKWLLRGVATCLYGADSKTSTQVLKYQSNTYEEKMTPQEQLKQFTELFGAELANKYFTEGLDLDAATKQFNAVLKERIDEHGKQLAAKDAEIEAMKLKLAEAEKKTAEFSASAEKIGDLEKQLAEANGKIEIWEKQYGGYKYNDAASGQGMTGTSADTPSVDPEKAYAAELQNALNTAE